MKTSRFNLITRASLFFFLAIHTQSVWAQQNNTPRSNPEEKSVEQTESSPSMEETVAWLKSKLEGHGVVFQQEYVLIGEFPAPVGEKTERGTMSREFIYKNIKFNKCTVSWQNTGKVTVHGEPIPWGSREFTLNLSELDPLAVKVIEYLPDLPFGSPDDWKVQKNIFSPEVWILVIKQSSRTNSGEYVAENFLKAHENFVFTDREMAKRVSKAFQHAIKLCGGKVEPF